MKIIHDLPPNYEQIIEVFPEVAKNKLVVFTWGPAIYVQTATDKLPMDLDIHEQYHWQRQKETSIEEWWAQYLVDPDFRAQEELGAYQRQYKYARRHYSRSVFSEILDNIAHDLSGPIYGNIYAYEEAKDAIRGKYT